MTPEQIRERMRSNIEDVWGRSDASRLPELYAPDCIDHNPMPGQAPGLAGMVAVMDGFTAAFPDLQLRLTGTRADGDFGVDFWTFTATHTGRLFDISPTGRRVEFNGIDIARFDESGLIAEIWHVEDMARAFTQLGLLRAPGQP